MIFHFKYMNQSTRFFREKKVFCDIVAFYLHILLKLKFDFKVIVQRHPYGVIEAYHN